MKKNSYPAANIGSASLLMTFIVLCLVNFSALALSGAASEYQYSQKIASSNSDYYTASGEAARILQDIDRILHESYTASPENYDALIREKLGNIENAVLDFTGSETTVTYHVPINDAHLLKIILTIFPSGQTDQGYYKISAWQKVPASEWEGDNRIWKK